MKIGRITENVLKRSILQQIVFKREEVTVGAGIGRDCAIFSCIGDKNGISCTREGFLDRGVKPLFQNGVNVIAARGGEAMAVSLNLLLPADAPEELLKSLTAEAEAFCGARKIQIAEAGGRVSPEVLKPYGTATFYGVRKASDEDRKNAGKPKATAEKKDKHGTESEYHTVKAAKPGQHIVLSKWIGLEGTAILAKRHRESLLDRYPAWLVDEAEGFDRYLSTEREAEISIRAGARAIYNVSEGGIFAALWELAEGSGMGLEVDIKKIPLRQETVEVCNHCNANPYELLSGGCLLVTCDDGEAIAKALEAEGIPAAVVGTVTDGNDRLIRNEDETRYLDRPHTDEIYRDIEREKGEQR